MSRLRAIRISSIDQLRALSPAWDDLWWRSDVTLPTLRAELIAQWVEQFASSERFCALVVEDQGQWVAGLPLVRRRLWGAMFVAALPTNPWSSRGEMLLDPAAEVDAVVDCLVAAMAELPEQLLWLDTVALGSPHWEAVRRATERARVAHEFHVQYQVGWIEIGHDWDAYRAEWSRKHRQQMARHMRRLADRGEVAHRAYAQLAPEEVAPWMRRAFDVEDRSWKGAAGTSALQQPGVFSFFVRQAEQLARWGQLRLDFLEADGQPVAFNYGMTAKGVYHSCKAGYDAAYAEHSPGQLLRGCLLQSLHDRPGSRAMDCIGRITDAHRKWRPLLCPAGRVVIAPRRLLGRMTLHAYRHWWPYIRRWRATRATGRVAGPPAADPSVLADGPHAPAEPAEAAS